MQPWIIEGGEVLSRNGIKTEDLFISSGLIVDGCPDRADARIIDATGSYVLPGMVDIHGDAFERILQPRPGVLFPMEVSLLEADRQMFINGITTAFHGLAVSWEPGLRSMKTARDFMTTLNRIRPKLAADTKVNLRYETFAIEYMDEVAEWLEADPSIILSFNDHTTINMGHDVRSKKIGRMADRCGISREDAVAMLNEKWEMRDIIPAKMVEMAAIGRSLGLTMFAHDEDAADIRVYHRSLGISVSEFPMNAETADEAKAHGENIILGAPNVLRGGSQNNAIDAIPSILAGRCTVLASDYYYPAMMLAAFRLVDEKLLSLPQAWSLISEAPAKAAGLDDRGVIEAGKRADLILVDKESRQIRTVFVEGRKVFERE